MFKKLLLISTLSASALFAYDVGDTIDKNIQEKLNLKDNKIYIIDFFASWCASCKVELPLISKLDKTINKSKYKIIGVDSDLDIKKAKKFVKNLNLKFDVFYDNNSEIISKFNPIGLPAIYYIKDYKVKKVVYGAVDNIDKKIIIDLEKIGE